MREGTKKDGSKTLDGELSDHYRWFSSEIDAALTPAMQRLGYRSLGAHISVRDSAHSSHGVLSLAEADSLYASGGTVTVLFGFEARDEHVMRTVIPDDYQSADELWLRYDPRRGALNVSDFRWLPEGTAIAQSSTHGTQPLTRAEMATHLAALGRAVREFVTGPSAPADG